MKARDIHTDTPRSTSTHLVYSLPDKATECVAKLEIRISMVYLYFIDGAFTTSLIVTWFRIARYFFVVLAEETQLPRDILKNYVH